MSASEPEQAANAAPPKVYRGPGDTCCPCPYCTALREGTLPAIADQPSPWARRMGAT